MIRFLGAVLIAFGAAWMGLRAAADLNQRVRSAAALVSGLELLEQELWENGTAFPELMADLSRRVPEPAAALFRGCAAACGRLDRVPFGESWRALVETLEALGPEERDALFPLGEVLGRYEAEGQREAISRARAGLERAREQAEAERNRMGRVYQLLGLSGGGFLVILLL